MNWLFSHNVTKLCAKHTKQSVYQGVIVSDIITFIIKNEELERKMAFNNHLPAFHHFNPCL